MKEQSVRNLEVIVKEVKKLESELIKASMPIVMNQGSKFEPEHLQLATTLNSIGKAVFQLETALSSEKTQPIKMMAKAEEHGFEPIELRDKLFLDLAMEKMEYDPDLAIIGALSSLLNLMKK